MKIGFDAKRCFRNTTGLGNYSRHIVDMLSTRPDEFELHLYTPKPGSAYPGIPSHAIVHYPGGMWKGPMSSVWRISQVAKDASRDGIDIYHGLSNELPAGLSKLGIPSIVTIHDIIFERFPEFYKPIDRKIYRKKFKAAAMNSTMVVAVSEQTKRDLIDFYNIPGEKITVIYQDCHPAFGCHFEEEYIRNIRRKYALPEEFILQVGTLEERKNVGNTIRALKYIPEIPLILIGRTTAYWDSLQEEIRREGLEQRVIRLQVEGMDDLAVIYSQATVFAYPSRFEGFGIPVLEALRSGTPVVTTKDGVFPEAGGPDSIYIDPNNPEDIARGLKSLLSDKKLRQKTADAGLEFSEKFRSSRLLEQWTSLYQDLIK